MPSHYLNQCWLIVNWTPGNKFQWKSNWNSIIVIQGNAFEIVVCLNGSRFVQGDKSEISQNITALRGVSSVWPYRNGPEAGREAAWGSEFVPLKKHEVGSFTLLHKISRNPCCFGIRTFLKQYDCYESATIWYTDHQYLAWYSEIINNLQEIPLIFCNYAVRSCGTWRKGPGQSPRNVLSISDLELYITETSMGVCDPVTD